MKPSIVSCNRARLFIREYDNPYVTELHRNPILRTGDTRLDEPSSRRLCMGVDDSPFLFVEIGEIGIDDISRGQIALQRVSGEHYRGRWRDVGTPERLAALNCELAVR